GDEFIAIFINAEIGDVHKRMEIISSTLAENPIIVDGEDVAVSFSYGVASFPDDATSVSELFQIADTRMYSEKPVSTNPSLP
ncbi:MAG: diguanylate cyclase, partial [bacterium]|nr:diguanylate cyclase [bacterium]